MCPYTALYHPLWLLYHSLPPTISSPPLLVAHSGIHIHSIDILRPVIARFRAPNWFRSDWYGWNWKFCKQTQHSQPFSQTIIRWDISSAGFIAQITGIRFPARIILSEILPFREEEKQQQQYHIQHTIPVEQQRLAHLKNSQPESLSFQWRRIIAPNETCIVLSGP